MSDIPAFSRTAVGVAIARAVHQLLDHEPRILVDPVAVQLMDPDTRARITSSPALFQSRGALGLRSHVVLRSRYAEDRLKAATTRGVSQYILLGAGMDTFAYRQPEWARSLSIIEIDQPASQQYKLQQLGTAGIAISGNVYHLPINFERETLSDGLARANVERSRKTFFSWLGVTMYLTDEAIDSVLATVTQFAAGSEIVLTYSHPPRFLDLAGDRLATMSAAVGEPWLSRFTPLMMEAKLREAGFSTIGLPSVEELTASYYRNRKDALPAPRRSTLAWAQV